MSANNQNKQLARFSDITRIQETKIDKSLIVYHDPSSPEAENFKVLRTSILKPRDKKDRRIICVTSSVGGEGKTFVSTNLAISISQSFDPYALIIDADLRRSGCSKILGLSQKDGLSNYLEDPKDLHKYLIKAPVTKLTILPAGPRPLNPAELLTSSKMAELLQEVKTRYPDRYVIVDSPPINFASETMSLVQESDAVILVVRYGYSNKSLVKDAVKKIGEDKVLGIVFNAVERVSKSYSLYMKQYY